MPFTAVAVAAIALTAAAPSPPDPDWVLVTPKATWRARDSQGEAVFRDRLWLMGGWFDSASPPPRDVWNSGNGKDWHRETPAAPWRHSDLPMTIAFRDRLWLMGGWTNGRLKDHSASNEVWSSADGKHWECVTRAAAWSTRLAAGLVEFRGRMWLLGGTEDYYFGTDASLRNDVWSSADGREWKREAATAGWSPRAYHQAVAFRGRLWVLAGGSYAPGYRADSEVWSSADGATWAKAEAPPWRERLWFSAAVYRGRLWVLGGWAGPKADNLGDVWSTADGETWTEYKANVCWKARHEHSAYVWRDKLWVAGGHARPLSNEVWSLDVPEGWFGGR